MYRWIAEIGSKNSAASLMGMSRTSEMSLPL